MTEDELDALWSNLVDRSHKADALPLTEPERIFYAVNLLRGSVPRSGFLGYFENWSGSDISDAHLGLRALRLNAVRALLERAQNAVWGGRSLPDDATPQVIFPDSLSEEEYETQSDRLAQALAPIEEEFHEHDQAIWSALCAFADVHQLAPRS